MIRFYAPDIESVPYLPEEESAHCCRVLRLKTGSKIEIVDGKGNIFLSSIINDSPKKTEIKILQKIQVKDHWNPIITLAIAPTKNMDRMEWLVEKAVEIGVNRIVFLNCKNSVRRVIKLDRLRKIMISAMKQSLKAKLPVLEEISDFAYFVGHDNSTTKYIGYCDEKTPRKEFAKTYEGLDDISILIGPEGDFSSEEIELALSSHYIPVTFGLTRLRTETAAIYALCAAHTLIDQHENI